MWTRYVPSTCNICALTSKGAPARESRTGTWLVSPAAGTKKKKNDPCRTGPRNLKLGTLEHNIVSTDDPCCSTAQVDGISWVSAQELCIPPGPPQKKRLDTIRTQPQKM